MAVLDKNGTEYLWNKAKEKFAAKDDVPETPEGVVLYTEQALTDSQKAQARGNIGAVNSWEDLEDKPFGVEGGFVYVDEPAVEIAADLLFGMAGCTAPLVVGEKYDVIYNGVSYSCDAVLYDGAVALGNVLMMDGTGGTGEPFAVAGQYDGEVFSLMIFDVNAVLNGATEDFTVSVKIVGNAIKKLDDKYYDSTADWAAGGVDHGFIKNKPVSRTLNTAIEWDGDITGKEIVGGPNNNVLVKVNDNGEYGADHVRVYATKPYIVNEEFEKMIDFGDYKIPANNIKSFFNVGVSAVDVIMVEKETSFTGYTLTPGIWVRYKIKNNDINQMNWYVNRVEIYIATYTDNTVVGDTAYIGEITSRQIYLRGGTKNDKLYRITVDDAGALVATKV